MEQQLAKERPEAAPATENATEAKGEAFPRLSEAVRRWDHVYRIYVGLCRKPETDLEYLGLALTNVLRKASDPSPQAASELDGISQAFLTSILVGLREKVGYIQTPPRTTDPFVQQLGSIAAGLRALAVRTGQQYMAITDFDGRTL